MAQVQAPALTPAPQVNTGTSTSTVTELIREIVPLLEIALIAGIAYVGYKAVTGIYSLGKGAVEGIKNGVNDLSDTLKSDFVIRPGDAPGLREAIQAQPDMFVEHMAFKESGEVGVYFKHGATYKGKDLSNHVFVDESKYFVQKATVATDDVRGFIRGANRQRQQ